MSAVRIPAVQDRPVWAERALPPEPYQPLSEQLRVDAVVIGAGFTGLRAALDMAEGGVSVAVLDAEDVAAGASGRTGGQVNPMLPFNGPGALRKMLGPVYFERLAEASLGSADALFEFISKHDIDCDARQNGWLRVCHSHRAFAKARNDVKAWNSFGAGMQVVEGDDVRQLSGSTAYNAGVIAPRGGAVHPQRLAFGMASAAGKLGVKLYGNSRVTSLVRQKNSWTVSTLHGQIKTPWVIVATNGYTDALIPRLANSVLPMVPVQIATEPLSDDTINDILPKGHTISDSRRIIMYARREPDNRMVYGGLGRRKKDGSLSGFDWLVNDATRVFPQLSGVRWSHFWGGRIALTDDHLPHLHEPEPGMVVGLGYNGRGVAMSQLMGRVMADRALGAPSDSLPFPVTGIKPIPGRSLQVHGMRSMIALMRFLDYIETR